MRPLPEAAERVHRALIALYERDGRMPTYRQVAGALRLSIGAIQRQVANLERWGYLERAGDGSRNLRVLCDERGHPYSPVASLAERYAYPPIVGRVSAGPFQLAAPDDALQPVLVFGADVVADLVTLAEDDEAHGARQGDVVIREMRPAEPDDWVVDGWPVLGLWRRFW